MYLMKSRNSMKKEVLNRVEVSPYETELLSRHDKVFVTYANPKYYNILYYFLETLCEYTEYPIIVYIVHKYDENYKIQSRFDRFNIFKRFVYTNEHIWATKLYILGDTIIRAKIPTDFIYIDADTIANYTIDSLFNYSNLVSNIPYMSLHPTYKKAEQTLHNSLGKGKKIEFNKLFGHSNVIWYNKNCNSIILEGYKLIKKHKGMGDEIVLNYLQNKYGLVDNIHYMTPNYNLIYDYIEMKDIYKYLGKNDNYFDELSLNLFHGLKEQGKLKELTKKLLEFNELNKNRRTYYKLDK